MFYDNAQFCLSVFRDEGGRFVFFCKSWVWFGLRDAHYCHVEQSSHMHRTRSIKAQEYGGEWTLLY